MITTEIVPNTTEITANITIPSRATRLFWLRAHRRALRGALHAQRDWQHSQSFDAYLALSCARRRERFVYVRLLAVVDWR